MSPDPKPETQLRISREEAGKIIHDRILEGESLLSPSLERLASKDWEEWKKWAAKVRLLLDTGANLRSFFTTPDVAQAFEMSLNAHRRALDFLKMVPGTFASGEQMYSPIRELIREAVTQLRLVHRRLDLYPEANKKTVEGVAGAQSDTDTMKGRDVPSPGSDIFLVHGHDSLSKEAVARLLERLGLRVLILHEQANRGRTVIEKFENVSNVGYAVVLMTPDDLGTTCTEPDRLQPRARQNVILELGYFIGALGRNRVCALVSDTVEVPSDISGVLYIPLDGAGLWRLQLATEIKAAGISVDLNRLMLP